VVSVGRLVAVAAALAGLAACDVGKLDVFGDGDFSFGDGGFWASECNTDDECGSGRCCEVFLGGHCRDKVEVEAGQPVCSVMGDAGDLCICTLAKESWVCPGPFNEPPFTAECPASAPSCVFSPDQAGCICLDEELPDMGPAWTPVPSCPPASWGATDGGAPKPDAG
jgi:hypothetical protein